MAGLKSEVCWLGPDGIKLAGMIGLGFGLWLDEVSANYMLVGDGGMSTMRPKWVFIWRSGNDGS